MTPSIATRKRFTKEMAHRNRRARNRERARMLDELCALTGRNRGYAARFCLPPRPFPGHARGLQLGKLTRYRLCNIRSPEGIVEPRADGARDKPPA